MVEAAGICPYGGLIVGVGDIDSAGIVCRDVDRVAKTGSLSHAQQPVRRSSANSNCRRSMARLCAVSTSLVVLVPLQFDPGR